jgi:threonine dehydratase
MKAAAGNHAQALALAASTFSIPSYIIMPFISTPSKIAGTQTYTDHVIFSGSTSQEREEKVEEVIRDTGAILAPPYDHPDIMLGQGTTALELHQQYNALNKKMTDDGAASEHRSLRAVLTPCGGGGLLSGTAVYFADKPETHVFGAEPSYQGGDDGQRGLSADPPKRITTVKTLTIADGLRTPLGVHPWDIFTSGSDAKPKLLEGMYSVTEDQIKETMRLVMERMKVFVEPSGVVALAVVLYNESFRRWVYEKQEEEGGAAWDIAIVFSGGNTTIEAILGLFGGQATEGEVKRQEGVVGLDGKAVAENVPG